jgi:hypothetical protein
METNLSNFFAGSENLYKYLVSIGMLLIILTVYYPLKEKQELEILKIKLEEDVQILNFNIKENQINILNLQDRVKQNNADIKSLNVIEKINHDNHINHIECKQKYSEIAARQSYIKLYNILFWIFLPTGVIITLFGFIRWYIVKRIDDKMAELNYRKLQSEVDLLNHNHNG